MPKAAHILTGDSDIAAALRFYFCREAEKVTNVLTLQTDGERTLAKRIFNLPAEDID